MTILTSVEKPNFYEYQKIFFCLLCPDKQLHRASRSLIHIQSLPISNSLSLHNVIREINNFIDFTIVKYKG